MIKNKDYNLGYLGKITVSEGAATYWGTLRGTKKEIIISVRGDNKESVGINLSEKINQEKNKLLTQASELEELTLRIQLNGLDKTSQYYQTLQNKNMEENK